jgi:membrane fusion protein (multidrug efflux system)
MFKKVFSGRSFRLTYIILGATFIGLGFHWYFKNFWSVSRSHNSRPNFAMPVKVSRVKQQTVFEEAFTVGTVEANESVMVRPEISGRVAEILFQEGQRVNKGDLLVKLDDSIYLADAAESEAKLSYSEAHNQRQTSLYKKNYTSEGKKDEAISKFKVDEAALKRKKAQLEKTKIFASFEGFMGLRKISIGDYLQAGQDIAMLVDLDPIKVRFSLPEVYLHQLKLGQSIEISTDTLPSNKPLKGIIYAISPLIDEEGRNIEVKGQLPNSDFLLKPGMFVRVKVIIASRENALLIPEEAVIPQGEDHFIYKVIGGKAKYTQVRVGIRRSGMVEILQGLSLNDQVIIAGQIKINDGVPVHVASQKNSKEL